MALGLSFLSFPPFLSLLFLLSLSLFFFPSHSDGLQVVGGQHAMLAGALHTAEHPALIDPLHVYDHIPVQEGHLVVISRGVVIHCPVLLLRVTASGLVSSRAQLQQVCSARGNTVNIVNMFLQLNRGWWRTYPRTGSGNRLGHWFRRRLMVEVLVACRRLIGCCWYGEQRGANEWAWTYFLLWLVGVLRFSPESTIWEEN